MARAVHLTRVVRAPRAAVFGACTTPDEVARWWGPRGFTAPSVDLDPRPGGRYRIAMRPPEGEIFHVSGEFREVTPPSRLAYTFRYEEPDPDDRENLVTVSLRERGRATEVDVIQGPFVTEERRALHETGWTESLERLEELFARSLSRRGGASPGPPGHPAPSPW